MLSRLCNQTKQQYGFRSVRCMSKMTGTDILYKPTLSYFALQKSKDVLNNFAENACMHYDIKSNDFYKNYIDPLMYFTGIMYECDEQNEQEIKDKIWNKNNIYDNINLLSLSDIESNNIIKSNQSINDMILFLKDFNFYDKNIENEIQKALLYWKLEKFLCNDDNWDSFKSSKHESIINEDVIQKAMEYRLFYFNIMNLMFCKLVNKCINNSFNKNLLFLTLHENMYAIYDDLIDYKTDIKNSSFNIYIMYNKLFLNDIKETKININKYILKIEDIYQKEKKNINKSIINQYENNFKKDYNKNVIEKQFNYFV